MQNYLRLGILHHFLQQRKLSYLNVFKNYALLGEKQHAISKVNKWYSSTGNSSETNTNFENKNEQNSVLKTSGNDSRSNIGICADQKEIRRNPKDPPLTLSVRPYPKPTIKVKEHINIQTSKTEFQKTIMNIPNEILSKFTKWLQNRESVEMRWDSYFQHTLLNALHGLQESPQNIINDKPSNSTESASKLSLNNTNDKIANLNENMSKRFRNSCNDSMATGIQNTETRSNKTEDEVCKVEWTCFFC